MAWQTLLRYGKSFGTGFVVGLPIYVTISDYGFCVARVDGISMQPSLNPVGNKSDVVLLDRWTANNVYDIKRGDVVSLISPTEPDVKLIKRVIGLEGDVIKTLGYKKRYVSIPKGHCWLEGDHRGKSFDSNTFGPVSLGLINGLATRIIWPPNRWMKIERSIEKDRTPLRRSFNECTLSDMLQNRESNKRTDKKQDALKDSNDRSGERKSIDRLRREISFGEGVSNNEINEDFLKDDMENSLNDGTGNFLTQESNDLPESDSKSSSIEEPSNLAVDENRDLTTNDVAISSKDELRYEDKIEGKDKDNIASEIKFDFGTQETKTENDDSVAKIDDKINVGMKINNAGDGILTVEEYENIEESQGHISLENRKMNEIADSKSI